MNKSIFLLTLLFVGMLSISVTTKSELLGKWYVQSMEMAGSIEEFDSEDNAPWMEFQKDDVIILGEADRSPSASVWSYDAELNLVLIDALGDDSFRLKATEKYFYFNTREQMVKKFRRIQLA